MVVERDLQLNDLELDDATIAIIRERAGTLIDRNAAHAQKALEHAGNICRKNYKYHANSVNSTCDGMRVF